MAVAVAIAFTGEILLDQLNPLESLVLSINPCVQNRHSDTVAGKRALCHTGHNDPPGRPLVGCLYGLRCSWHDQPNWHGRRDTHYLRVSLQFDDIALGQ
jgi:hypothetical protein